MTWLEDVLRIGKFNLELKESQRITAEKCKTSLRNVNVCVRLTKLYFESPEKFKGLTSKRAAIKKFLEVKK